MPELRDMRIIDALTCKSVEAREAKRQEAISWGIGAKMRDFLFVDNCAEGVVRAARRITGRDLFILGTDSEMFICDLAGLAPRVAGHRCVVTPSITRPDDQPRHCLTMVRVRGRADVRGPASRKGFGAQLTGTRARVTGTTACCLPQCFRPRCRSA